MGSNLLEPHGQEERAGGSAGDDRHTGRMNPISFFLPFCPPFLSQMLSVPPPQELEEVEEKEVRRGRGGSSPHEGSEQCPGAMTVETS